MQLGTLKWVGKKTLESKEAASGPRRGVEPVTFKSETLITGKGRQTRCSRRNGKPSMKIVGRVMSAGTRKAVVDSLAAV